MRALDCDCGRHLEAADDQKLFDEVQKHVNRDHPETACELPRNRGSTHFGECARRIEGLKVSVTARMQPTKAALNTT